MSGEPTSLRPNEMRFSGGKFLLACLVVLIVICAIGFGFTLQALNTDTERPPVTEEPAQTVDMSGGPSST